MILLYYAIANWKTPRGCAVDSGDTWIHSGEVCKWSQAHGYVTWGLLRAAKVLKIQKMAVSL